MPIVENHSEHPFHVPPQSVAQKPDDDSKASPLDVKPVVYQDAIMFERCGPVDADGNPVPSRTKISDAQLKRLREHPVARSWFKPAGGKLQLRVVEDGETVTGPVTDQSKKPSLGSVGGNQGAEIKKPEKA